MVNLPKHRDAHSGRSYEPLDEHATFRLGINYGFRGAFTEDRPLSREQYEKYSRSPRGAYFVVPPYEEYLRLYEIYSEVCRLRDDEGVNANEAAERVRSRSDAEKFKHLGPLE